MLHDSIRRKAMKSRLLAERPLPRDGNSKGQRAARRAAAGAERDGHLAEIAARLVRRAAWSASANIGWREMRGDWERAGLGPRVTMCWDSPPAETIPAGQPITRPDATQIAARKRFDLAARAVGPPSRRGCGAWSAPARACATPKPRWAVRPERKLVARHGRSTGWRIITGLNERSTGRGIPSPN